MKIHEIAEICHNVNMFYCRSINDFSQVPWEEAPEWQKQSAIDGVKYMMNNRDSSPENLHKNWLKEKEIGGWTYGPVKNSLKKQHPCFLPYEDLPDTQKIKDSLFRAIVLSLI